MGQMILLNPYKKIDPEEKRAVMSTRRTEYSCLTFSLNKFQNSSPNHSGYLDLFTT